MRDLLMLGFMLAVVPLAIRNTYIAYILWGWAGLIGIKSYLYGFMQSVSYAQWFAIVALVTIFMKRDKEQLALKVNATGILMFAFGLQCLLTAACAYSGLERNWEIGIDIQKTLLFCILMPMLVVNRLRIHAFIIMMALGLGFHGMLDGLKFLASGGSHLAGGLQKFGDNNNTAVALATVIPLLLYAARYSTQKWAKVGFMGVMVLTVLAIMASRSRGGFVTLLVMAAWMIWHTKRKVAGLAILSVCLVLATALAPASWTDRMDSIQEASEDNSFMTRVAAWKKSSAIALEHPFTGGGFYAVQAPVLYAKYVNAQGLLGFIDTPNPFNFAAHSIYFEVMGDTGFIGFFLYLALFINASRIHKKILKLAKKQGSSTQWAVDLSNSLGYSMVAFLVGGSLVSAAYFDIPFVLIALMQCTWQILSAQDAPKKSLSPIIGREAHA